MTQHEEMIISALRYALPRGSYVMSDTDNYITAMLKDKCSKKFLACLIRDIEEHQKSGAGKKSSVFEYNWTPLLTRIKEANK